MSSHPTRNTRTDFLGGVVEGFYGKPWSASERAELFDWMASWGLNTYLYAPKDDLKHRALWRQVYSPSELALMKELVAACRKRELYFIYALSPGLDIRFNNRRELDRLRRRLAQMSEAGCVHFALLFDDIPGRLDQDDLRRWGSPAAAQSHVANTLFGWLREWFAAARFLFCPTPYCGRMAERGHGGEHYLEILGRDLAPEIDVMWTGPEIISREIGVAHIEQVGAMLRRRPLIWDNLHANDYDGRRFFCGPYSGRAPELRAQVNGILSNPNCEQPLNFVPLRTLAAFLKSHGNYDPRQAYLAAIKEWLPRFETVRDPITFEDLVLFGDCYYLPHEEGPEAEALLRDATGLVARQGQVGRAKSAFAKRAGRLRDFCARVTELRDRGLFQALSRRTWDLREELELLSGFVAHRGRRGRQPFHSDFHLPGTYRGGLVARMQRLLEQRPDGSFTANTTRGRIAGGRGASPRRPPAAKPKTPRPCIPH